MARINLTSGKGWFRIWLVLSIAYWLFLTGAVIMNWRPGLPLRAWVDVLLGGYAVPFFVYVAAWIMVRAVRWIRAGFRGAE